MIRRAERRQEEATGGAKSRPKVTPTGRAEKSAGRAEKRPYRAKEKAADRQEAADRQRRGHRSRAAEQDRSRQPTGGPPLLCPVLCVRLRHRTGRGPQGGSEEQPPAFVVSCRSSAAAEKPPKEQEQPRRGSEGRKGRGKAQLRPSLF